MFTNYTSIDREVLSNLYTFGFCFDSLTLDIYFRIVSKQQELGNRNVDSTLINLYK